MLGAVCFVLHLFYGMCFFNLLPQFCSRHNLQLEIVGLTVFHHIFEKHEDACLHVFVFAQNQSGCECCETKTMNELLLSFHKVHSLRYCGSGGELNRDTEERTRRAR